MNYYNRLVTAISHKLSEKQDKVQQDVITYGVEVLLSFIFTTLFLVLIGYILGALNTTLVVALTCLVLRFVTGGTHSRSLLGCTIITIIFLPMLGLAAKYIQFNASTLLLIIIFVSTFAFVIFYKFAPVDCAEKPIVSASQRSRFKKLSLILLVVIFILQIYMFSRMPQFYELLLAISIGILWQTMQLTFIGRIIVKLADWNFNPTRKGGEFK